METITSEPAINSYLEQIREEIKLIQNQERFYRSESAHGDVQKAAHARRQSRLLEIRAQLGKLRNLHGASSLIAIRTLRPK